MTYFTTAANLELTIKTVKSTLCQFENLPSKNVSHLTVTEIGVTKPRYPDQISPGADVSSRDRGGSCFSLEKYIIVFAIFNIE